MTSEEQRIREFAYQIWQSEGCPHGQDERHWEMARKLVEAENGIPTAKPASRSRKTATKPTDISAVSTTPVVKPASKPRTTRAAPKQDATLQAGAEQPAKKPRSPRAKKDV